MPWPPAAPGVHSGAGHPTASPLCPTVGQSMWQPVPFLATSVLPRITQPKMLWVSQLNQHSVIALFEERQTEWQKERVSFVMVTSLSGCCFLARFAAESQALAALELLPSKKARDFFILSIIFVFPGFGISLAGSSSPPTPSVIRPASGERTVG